VPRPSDSFQSCFPGEGHEAAKDARGTFGPVEGARTEQKEVGMAGKDALKECETALGPS
jgi:hypothetical protein